MDNKHHGSGAEAKRKQRTLPAAAQRDLSKAITDFFSSVALFAFVASTPLRLTGFSIDCPQL